MIWTLQDGYLEAIVRGYKGGLLSSTDYTNLAQCENLEDVKLHLVCIPRVQFYCFPKAKSE